MNKELTGIYRLAPAIIFGCLFVCLFANVLFFPNLLAYRDATHYFARVFQFIQNEWSAGRIPLWNPHSNCGEPILANGTSSVFYPGKLIFFLPVPFWFAYNLYVLLHVVLAGVFSFQLSKSWGTSRLGATICALSFTFCGNVLYQYGNVIYLVGAAWLPLAFWTVDRMLRDKSIGAAIGLGVILALMVLGGEPQMAYHAGFLAAVYALICRGERNTDELSGAADRRSICNRPMLLAAAAICGVLLCAVQVFPTVEWSRESIRGRQILPQNLYDIPGHLLSDARLANESGPNWYAALLGKSSPPPTQSTYEYSLAPWRLTEFVWPWISGCSLSQDRRWIHRFDEERDWVPSLYMGILPFILALSAWKIRGASPRIKWMSIIVVFSLVASFGKFGLGWLWCTLFCPSAETIVGDPFGGLYWLMVTVLPGYDSFRWPAKLLVITAMCASVLAGFGWDRAFDGRKRWMRDCLIFVSALSLIGMVITMLGHSWWDSWLADMPTHSALGPFDSQGARQDVLLSFVQVLTVCAVLAVLLHVAVRRQSESLRWLILIVVAIDLGIANGWMITSTPARQFNDDSELAQIIKRMEAQQAETDTEQQQLFRTFRGDFQPKRWSEVSTSERFAEINQWAARVLLPMHHLSSKVDLVIDDRGTFMNYDLLLLMQTRLVDPVSGKPLTGLLPRRAIEALNAKYLALPKPDGPPGNQGNGARAQWTEVPLPSTSSQDSRGYELLYKSDFFPRAWIVHDLIVIPSIDRQDYRTMYVVSGKIGYWSEQVPNLRQTAIVESDSLDEGRWKTVTKDGEETCRIVHYEPQRIEIDVHLIDSGLVVLSDLFEKNWIVTDETNGQSSTLEIHRTNRVMRGVKLGPGEHHLVFEYVPISFYVGAWISAVAWTVLLIGAMLWCRSRLKVRRGELS